MAINYFRLVLCSGAAATHALVVLATGPARRVVVGPQMSLEGVPEEVVEAERKATPGRPARLAGTAALGVLSTCSAGLCVATLLGQPQAAAMAVLPFGNAPLSLGVNVAIGGACAWVWQQEMLTREQNVLRIWEEVQRRKAAAAPGKKQPKLAKTPAELRSRGAAPFAPAPVAPAPSQQTPSLQPASEKGLLERVVGSSFIEQANAMARVQAMSLNGALEARGVLPPIERGSANASGDVAPPAAPLPAAEPARAAVPIGMAPFSAKKSKKNKSKKR